MLAYRRHGGSRASRDAIFRRPASADFSVRLLDLFRRLQPGAVAKPRSFRRLALGNSHGLSCGRTYLAGFVIN
jgi:hypothetical protein